MKILGMRWGGDEGSSMVEIMVADKKGELFFVLESLYENFARVDISPLPLFDLATHMADREVDFEVNLAKLNAAPVEHYDFQLYDYPQEMMDSPFADVCKLACRAMEDCPPICGEDWEEAHAFIVSYLGQEAADLGLSFPVDEDEEEFEEDEEE